MKTYNVNDVCAFSKANEPWGHFGNMAGGYPLRISPTILVPSVENLYQAMRFTGHPDIQQHILDQKSGFGAKLASKKYRNTHTREDFEDIKVDIMYWCLRLKCAQHRNYRNLLLETGNRDIVEISKKDDFWGAKPINNQLVGENVLGELHMRIRNDVQTKPIEELKNVITPPFDNFTLCGIVL